MVKNLEEAFDYVNQRYVFNKENYPIIAKLTTQEIEFFSLKHTLLHMQKSIDEVIFLERNYKSVGGRPSHNEPIVKIIINMLKASELVHLSPKEILDYEYSSAASTGLVSEQILDVMREMATQCEVFDHNSNPLDLTSGVICVLKIKQSLKKSWTSLFSISLKDKERREAGMHSFLIDYVWSYIPDYMKN